MPDTKSKKPIAILITQYVMGQHGSSSYLQDVVVPVGRIAKVDNAVSRPVDGSSPVMPPSFAASYRSRLTLKAPEEYMWAVESHLTIMRWMNEGQETRIVNHGSNTECPEVRAGKWEYCKGHKEPIRE